MGAEDLHPELPRASVRALARARAEATAAWESVRIWRHGGPDEYTTAGQNAITHINRAISHLEHTRGALLAEQELVTQQPPQPAPDTPSPSGAGTPDAGSLDPNDLGCPSTATEAAGQHPGEAA